MRHPLLTLPGDARTMAVTGPDRHELLRVLALVPPLVARLYGEGAEAAVQRLLLLLLALGIAYAWAALFAHRAKRPLGPGLPTFATTFVLLLPGPIPWGGAILALSFGAVFGREIFGGRAILPPALIGLAFAIFSFPEGNFEERGILALSPDLMFTMACLPGAAVLVLKGSLSWHIAVGAVVGATVTALLMGDPAWWEHFGRGVFAAGILFLTAMPEVSVTGKSAKWLHGILVGTLIIVIRLADPNQPDGVVLAALLGALFAPLLDRAIFWRSLRG